MSADLVVVLAHPALHRSRINATLAEAAAGVDGVAVVDLYEMYPDFDIDVAAEQNRIVAARGIVLQHPFYWYSCPALLKEWIDLVLEYGWAYGMDARSLEGKTLAHAISTGADPDAYSRDGINHWTIDEFIRPFEATARFCGMRWVPPFRTHGGHLISDEEIGEAAAKYRDWLSSLARGE